MSLFAKKRCENWCCAFNEFHKFTTSVWALCILILAKKLEILRFCSMGLRNLAITFCTEKGCGRIFLGFARIEPHREFTFFACLYFLAI